MGADPSVVRRSQRHSVEVRNKKPVQYGAYVSMPLIIILLFMFFGIFFFMLCQFKWGRKLLESVSELFFDTFSLCVYIKLMCNPHNVHVTLKNLVSMVIYRLTFQPCFCALIRIFFKVQYQKSLDIMEGLGKKAMRKMFL